MKRHEFVESAYRTTAALTAAGAAFLGGVTLKSAEAYPLSHTTTEHIDKKPAPKHGLPKGAKYLNSEKEIEAEAQFALTKLKRRWQGAAIVHTPTKIKDANISFATSPSSYFDIGQGYGFLGQQLAGKHYAKEVYDFGIMKFNNINYMVIYDDELSKFGFLNMDWAIKAGAIDFEKIQGIPEKSVAYNPYQDEAPGVQSLIKYKGPKTAGNILFDNKIRKLTPSHKIPHP